MFYYYSNIDYNFKKLQMLTLHLITPSMNGKFEFRFLNINRVALCIVMPVDPNWPFIVVSHETPEIFFDRI